MASTEEIRAAFVQSWGAMGPFWGVPPTTAGVYGWLPSLGGLKRREWGSILEHLRERLRAFEREGSEEAAVFRERMAQIEALVAAAGAMAGSFLEGGLVQRLGRKLLVSTASAKRDTGKGA